MYVETVIYPKQPFLSLLSQVPYMVFHAVQGSTVLLNRPLEVTPI